MLAVIRLRGAGLSEGPQDSREECAQVLGFALASLQHWCVRTIEFVMNVGLVLHVICLREAEIHLSSAFCPAWAACFVRLRSPGLATSGSVLPFRFPVTAFSAFAAPCQLPPSACS